MKNIKKYVNLIAYIILFGSVIGLSIGLVNTNKKFNKLIKEISEKDKIIDVTNTDVNKNNNTNIIDKVAIGNLGENIELNNTNIILHSIKYSKSFNVRDYNNGGIIPANAEKGEQFVIFDFTINTTLDPAKTSSKAYWEMYDFIDSIKINKGYSPTGSWGNPHPCKITINKDNRVQLAYSINDGDKLDEIILKDPSNYQRVRIKGD